MSFWVSPELRLDLVDQGVTLSPFLSSKRRRNH